MHKFKSLYVLGLILVVNLALTLRLITLFYSLEEKFDILLKIVEKQEINSFIQMKEVDIQLNHLNKQITEMIPVEINKCACTK